MSAHYPSASGAPSVPSKVFARGDDNKKAIEVLKRMREFAQSKGIYDFVCGPAAPIILVRPGADEAGGTIASKVAFDNKMKAAEEQEKAIATVLSMFTDSMTSEAFTLMLQKTRTSMLEILNPRDVYDRFKTAFCTLSSDKVHELMQKLNRLYVLGTPLVDFIMEHSCDRQIFEMNGYGTPQATQVLALKAALHNLFTANYDARRQIDMQHAEFANDADAFAAYVMIILNRESDGQFANQQNPALYPSKVNAISEPSAAKGPSKSFSEQSGEAKKKFKDFPLGNVCPAHKAPISGLTHTWGECSLFKGTRHVHKRPDGK